MHSDKFTETIGYAQENISLIEHNLDACRGTARTSIEHHAYLVQAIKRMRYLRNCIWHLERLLEDPSNA